METKTQMVSIGASAENGPAMFPVIWSLRSKSKMSAWCKSFSKRNEEAEVPAGSLAGVVSVPAGNHTEGKYE